MHRPTNYERIAEVYDAGRRLPLEWIDGWRELLDPFLSECALPVLDLGSGTGLWSEAFAAWFECDIVAVEPSAAMRREALEKRLPPQVLLVGGGGERIPLKDGSCVCAWLSTVVHHFSDVEACASELYRVVDSGGHVLIRNAFGDRLDGIHWLDFFPEARETASKRWPTVDATTRVFAAAGFEAERFGSVSEVIASDLHAYAERIRVRANSTLNVIDDEAFEAGIARLERFAAERPLEEVVEQRDFLVLRRPGG
jgi:SAM-dependent methyltransferase